MSGAFVSIVRQGPPELFRGFLASSLRDAPYAGLFMVFYEGIKSKACKSGFTRRIRNLTLRSCHCTLEEQSSGFALA